MIAQPKRPMGRLTGDDLPALMMAGQKILSSLRRFGVVAERSGAKCGLN